MSAESKVVVESRQHTGSRPPALSWRRIVSTWWPLAASWLLMGAELPVLSAVIARLPEPEINLAAYGGVVFPLILIIESPIIMLLAASTALSKDLASYRKLYRFMMVAGASLTVLHLLLAFTPLYYFVVRRVIGVPVEIIEPARTGFMIMLPWTWAIAYRRFNQGVMIRFGHTRAVGVGTAIRLGSEAAVLAAGYLLGNLSGVVVATCGVATGVTAEAMFAGLRVRPVLNELRGESPVDPPLTLPVFLRFYVPLVMTSLLTLLAQPIGSSALSRMPDALPSLAVWPVVGGLVFLARSVGMAYNEVVVALLDEPDSVSRLRSFAFLMALITSGALLVVTATPLAGIWFGQVAALEPVLAGLARNSLWIAVAIPGLTMLQSWYQGVILYSKKTGGISQAVAVNLFVNLAVLWVGIASGRYTGLYVGLAGMVLGTLAQTFWLAWRSRPAISEVQMRDLQE